MSCPNCGSKQLIRGGGLIACFNCHHAHERKEHGWVEYEGDKRVCDDCGTVKVRRDGQKLDGVAIVRHYCEPCGTVTTTFEITTQNPKEDAERLLS